MKKTSNGYENKHNASYDQIDTLDNQQLMGEEFLSESSNKRKASVFADDCTSTNDDLNVRQDFDNSYTSTKRVINEATPTRPYRRVKKSLELSDENSFDEDYATYLKKKLDADLEIKKHELSIKALELKIQASREVRYDRYLDIYTKPHDHLSGSMLENVLAHKRVIAKIFNWPCDF